MRFSPGVRCERHMALVWGRQEAPLEPPDPDPKTPCSGHRVSASLAARMTWVLGMQCALRRLAANSSRGTRFQVQTDGSLQPMFFPFGDQYIRRNYQDARRCQDHQATALISPVPFYGFQWSHSHLALVTAAAGDQIRVLVQTIGSTFDAAIRNGTMLPSARPSRRLALVYIRHGGCGCAPPLLA